MTWKKEYFKHFFFFFIPESCVLQGFHLCNCTPTVGSSVVYKDIKFLLDILWKIIINDTWKKFVNRLRVNSC